MKKLYLPVFILFAVGCASTPAPKMQSPQSAAVGIEVSLRTVIGLAGMGPDYILFAQIDDNGGVMQDEVIPSNYSSGNRFYLLNAAPGRYVAVAALASSKSTVFETTSDLGSGVSASTSLVGKNSLVTYFSEELVDATAAEVAPGGLAYMGEYTVRQSPGMDGAGPVQRHYAQVVAPGQPEEGVASVFSTERHLRGSIKEVRRNDDAEEAFVRAAMDDLKEGGWDAIVQ